MDRKQGRRRRASLSAKPVTVHITGPGVAYVDPLELLRSDEVGRLLDDMDEVYGEAKPLPGAKEGR